MTLETDLLARIPEKTLGGKNFVIRKTLGATLLLKGAWDTAKKRSDLTPLGQAVFLERYLKSDAVPALAACRRQLAHDAAKLDKQRQFVRTKAAGEFEQTDWERRDFLRTLPLADRVQEVLNNPAARGAALRMPDLTGLPKRVIEDAMKMQIAERCPAEGADLQVAEEAQELHEVSVQVLRDAILETPTVAENGGVRKLSGKDLERYIEIDVPPPTQTQIEKERAESDAIIWTP